MLRYPISTLLYLVKINIKDKIQDILKLHNNIDIRVEAKVIDKNGKIIKYHKQRSHSFVSNFLNLLGTQFYNPEGGSNILYNIITTSNSSDSCVGIMAINVSNGNSSYGMVIGTGTATPTPNDYQLEMQINNGTSSNQMVYGAHSFVPSSNSVNVSGSTSSFQIIRTFTNSSGSAITVSEVGIITQILNKSDTNYDNILIVHDLLSSPISVPNGSTLTITYTISVTT